MTNDYRDKIKEYEKTTNGISAWVSLAGITCPTEDFLDWVCGQLQSERQAHAETKARLEALEDAIESISEEDEDGDFYIDGGWIISGDPINGNLKKLYQAIQNSRSRQKDKN